MARRSGSWRFKWAGDPAPDRSVHRPYLAESGLPPSLNAGLEWLPASPGAGSAALELLGALGAGSGGVGTAVGDGAGCVDCACGTAVGMGAGPSCHIRRRARPCRRRSQGWKCDVSLRFSRICTDKPALAIKSNRCRHTPDVCTVPNAPASGLRDARRSRARWRDAVARPGLRGVTVRPGTDSPLSRVANENHVDASEFKRVRHAAARLLGCAT